VTTEDALAALQREATRQEQKDLEEEELDDLAEFYNLRKKQHQEQMAVPSSSSSDEGEGSRADGGFLGNQDKPSSSSEPRLEGPSSSALTGKKPAIEKHVFKVVAKPKPVPPAQPKKEDKPNDDGKGLASLLGYGSSGSDS
jgi:hypothetical protein